LQGHACQIFYQLLTTLTALIVLIHNYVEKKFSKVTLIITCRNL